MNPSITLTILAFPVLCLAIPAVHGVASYFGVAVSVRPAEFDPNRANTIAFAVCLLSSIAGFWHWWDVFAYRGPKLGSDYEPRHAGKCLATVSAIHLVALPVVLIAVFSVSVAMGNTDKKAEFSLDAYPRGPDRRYFVFYIYPLFAFLLCRWFAKTEGPRMPDRGVPLRSGSGG